MNCVPTMVIVTPVRDEAGYIGHTLDSVERQTCRPAQWVIVDDGSTDGTGAMLDAYAARHPWVHVLHRDNRGFRSNGGGVMDAFYAGYNRVDAHAWDFLVKLDGDLSFEPDYLEQCLEHFAHDAKLGIGGGTICSVVDGALEVESSGDPPFHVRGATKIYRRDCWDQIAPLIKAPGWDTLDEVRANFFGWKTRTFAELRVVQHKPTGSADGSWANAFKNGKANYLTGYHPAFMFAKCARRAFRAPFLVGAAGLAAGFLSGYLERLPPLADVETIRFLRREQIRRLTFRRSIYG